MSNNSIKYKNNKNYISCICNSTVLKRNYKAHISTTKHVTYMEKHNKKEKDEWQERLNKKIKPIKIPDIKTDLITMAIGEYVLRHGLPDIFYD
jgi:hypothetical protein